MSYFDTNQQVNVYGPLVEKTLGEYIKAIQENVLSDEPKYNSVDKPKHYMLFEDQGIEVRDVCKVMSEKISEKGYSAFFVSDYVQMLQYILRFQDKNGKEDLSKAKYYLKKLMEDHGEG